MTNERTQMGATPPVAKTTSVRETKKSVPFKDAFRLQESFTAAGRAQGPRVARCAAAGASEFRPPDAPWFPRHVSCGRELCVRANESRRPDPRDIVSGAQLVWRQPGRNACAPSQPAAATVRLLCRSHDRYLRRILFDGRPGDFRLCRLEDCARNVRRLPDAFGRRCIWRPTRWELFNSRSQNLAPRKSGSCWRSEMWRCGFIRMRESLRFVLPHL